ncbi:serine/threonine-protein kinase [Streptomyces sp. 71268]|uniref:serine/threonine-protein kinase n=1 Tax=Streptomyces sp. 71268 TaxID=3002640 RepID=UPI0023F647F7|nr:serine/threonine-protein kinase [Streptomyces sp. 71268]WEV29522.1 serine/threonine-protein kinase [Streptomyces sp. 71268]
MLSALLPDDPYTLGPYRLLARLGGGGMGTVYLARTAGGRTVAVKTLHDRLAAQPALRARFRLETDVARVIGGRYGAAVHDADPSAPRPWLATEYVIGPPLDVAVQAGGALPAPAVRVVGAALAEGLARLHRSEAVHRDLKPSNILLTASGPKIIDFGIAQAIGADQATQAGDAVGTPAFMSPEQAAGLEHGAAGDVFALAGVLVFAATGHGPFGAGGPAELLFRVRYAEPDLGGVDPDLAPVLARCLAKDPASRPTLDELATELGTDQAPPQWVDALPDAVLREIARRGAEVWRTPPDRQPPPPPAAPAPAGPAAATAAPGLTRRRLIALTGGGALAGAGLTGGGVWAWLANRDTTRNDVRKPARPTAAPAKPPTRLWTFPIRCPEEYGDVLPTKQGLAVPAGIVLTGVNAESGEGTWQANMGDGWRWASDGTRVHALREHDEGRSLALGEIDPTSGRLGELRVDTTDFAGDEARNQLLCVAGGRAYLVARTTSGNRWYLLAVALRTGREHWRRPVDEPADQYGPPFVGGSVTGGNLFLWRKDSYTESVEVAVHATGDGRQRWSETEDYSSVPPSRVVRDERHVYLCDEAVMARDLADGTLGWLFGENGSRDVGDSAGEERVYGAPALRDGVLYCAQGDRGVVAVDALTGSLNWLEKDLKGRRLNRDVPPVIGRKYLYSLDDQGLRAVDLTTRRAVWTYETDATVLTPDYARERLYVREPRETFALPLA